MEANLTSCEDLSRQAAHDGAELISLPEFFTTGIGFIPDLADKTLAPDGAATQMMCRVAAEEGVTIGGSFLCRDDDGDVRNAFLVVGPAGVLGRHDKDLPTMVENAFYVGGDDDGIIPTPFGVVGVAMCWELIRSQTARRLVGEVDVVLGGSAWLTIPPMPPRFLSVSAERANAALAASAPAGFARLVGVPVVQGAISGRLTCRLVDVPFMTYRGGFQGGAVIADAHGRTVARRDRSEGSGVVVADVELGPRKPFDPVPDGYWLSRRDPVSATVWHTQRLAGRRYYRKHVRGRLAYEVDF